MKRDMELIRQILLRIEESDTVAEAPTPPESIQRIGYHLSLLADAGMITGIKFDEDHITGEMVWYLMPVPRLTWSGHEFLDAARDESTWNQAKEQLAKAGKSMATVAMSVLSALLVEISKRQLGL
jgi:Hypothetical protein (DUF2513)